MATKLSLELTGSACDVNSGDPAKATTYLIRGLPNDQIGVVGYAGAGKWYSHRYREGIALPTPLDAAESAEDALCLLEDIVDREPR